MINAAIIEATLQRVAARAGDPKAQIYACLFERHPEYEEMFVMDTDGGVRGSMLETSLNCLIGVANNQSETPRYLIEAARMIHDGYGLRDDDLDAMFIAMRDVFREILAADWTAAEETEWTKLLAELASIRSPT